MPKQNRKPGIHLHFVAILLITTLNASAQKKDSVNFLPAYDLTLPKNFQPDTPVNKVGARPFSHYMLDKNRRHTLEYIPVEYLDEKGFYARPVHLILRDDTLYILIPGAESLFKGAKVVTIDGLYFKKENKRK